MKETFSQIHRVSKTVFIIGCVIVAFMLAVSAILYIGAGELLDYYSSVEISEKLLETSRPVCVTVCIGSLFLEYFLKQRKNTN